MKVALPTLPPASPGQLAWAGLGSALLELTLAAILLAAFVDRAAPPQDLPWKPFSLDHPLGLATGAKLAMITADPARCRAALLAEDVGFAVAPDRTRGFCSTVDSVRLGDPALSPRGPVMRCDLALTYEVWRRHVVEPAARRTLGSELSRIEHLGGSSRALLDAIDRLEARGASLYVLEPELCSVGATGRTLRAVLEALARLEPDAPRPRR